LCAGKAKGSPAAATENARLASTNNASQARQRWESIMTPHMPSSAREKGLFFLPAFLLAARVGKE